MSSRDPLRPNLVLVLTDDQGYWAAGCYGNEEIKTPRLDGMAQSGLRAEHFFCTSPVCSPSRASLLTGQIPSQHGVHDAVHAGHVAPDGIDFLASASPTFVEVLASHGYRCGISGKWHLGDATRQRPGFEHWYVHQAGAGPYFAAPMVRDGRLVREPAYITDAITDDALSFVQEADDDERPFCLIVAYTAPHAPWVDQHPPELLDLYADTAFETCPQEPAHPWASGFPLADGRRGRVSADVDRAVLDPRASLQGYFAAVSGVDAGLGRIIHALEDRTLASSTLVCFTSDNGFNAGHHGIWGKGNGTFPLNVYDTSVRVPAIFNQPGRVPAGVTSTALLSGYDLFPTLLDWAGVEAPATLTPKPGASFAQLLETGVHADGADHVVVYDEYGPVRMIRSNDWKYVRRHPSGPDELYDLRSDPQEKRNLDGDARCDRVREDLRHQLSRWFDRYVDSEVDGLQQAVTGLGQLDVPRGPPGARVYRQFRLPT